MICFSIIFTVFLWYLFNFYHQINNYNFCDSLDNELISQKKNCIKCPMNGFCMNGKV